jgi:alpha/beta superfamily hydrolase
MPGPDLQAAFIPSASHTLLGGLYRAAHPPNRPAVLLLHGLPGHEKNLDLAIDLQDHGIHCLYVHYRGSWGSAGEFSIDGLAADATAALDWLTARKEVDPQRVAIVGFSLGGWVALALSASRPGVAACVAVAPLIDPRSVPLPADLAAESAATLHGATSQSLTQEWAALPPATEFADSLRSTPVLLVTADADELFPPAHYLDLTAAVPGLDWVRFPRAGHSFAGVRPGLRHVVADYLCRRLA